MAKHNFTPRKTFNRDGSRNREPFILGIWIDGKYVEREVTPLRSSKLDNPSYREQQRKPENWPETFGGGQ